MRARPWFWRLTLLALLLVIGIGVTLMNAAALQNLQQLQESVTTYVGRLALVRLSLIAIAVCVWPMLVRLADEHGFISEPAMQELEYVRWRLAAALLAFELAVSGGELMTMLTASRAAT